MSIAAIFILLLIPTYICFKKKIDLFIVALTTKKRMQKKLKDKCVLNNYLLLNDFYLPVDDNNYYHIDSLIIGNKNIYLIKEIRNIGKLVFEENDSKWRLIYSKKLTLIDNPFKSNDEICNNLLSRLLDLDFSRIYSIAMLSKTIKYDKNSQLNHRRIIVNENNIIKVINKIENESDIKPFTTSYQEKLAKYFYDLGMDAEKKLKDVKLDND